VDIISAPTRPLHLLTEDKIRESIEGRDNIGCMERKGVRPRGSVDLEGETRERRQCGSCHVRLQERGREKEMNYKLL
jgi:hypothetical protein